MKKLILILLLLLSTVLPFNQPASAQAAGGNNEISNIELMAKTGITVGNLSKPGEEDLYTIRFRDPEQVAGWLAGIYINKERSLREQQSFWEKLMTMNHVIAEYSGVTEHGAAAIFEQDNGHDPVGMPAVPELESLQQDFIAAVDTEILPEFDINNPEIFKNNNRRYSAERRPVIEY